MSSSIYSKFAARAIDKAIPLQASLELTYRCNERCTHCYIEDFKDDPKRVLTKEEWFTVLKELRQAGTLYVILMGGEPLLSPYVFDVAKKGSEIGFHMSLISNGLKIKSLEYARKLKDSGVKMVTFSLYSLDAKIHDKMTAVRGSHEKTLQAIEYCDQAGIEVTLNGLLTEANSRGIFDYYDWAVSRGYDLKVDPNVTAKLNGNLSPTQYRATKETLLWFYRERSRRWKNSIPAPSLETENSYICNAAKGKCAVTPYGELLPCIEIREPFGSLITQKFNDIWHSKEALKWREPRLKDIQGEIEEGLYNFCDHCPGMAKNEKGAAMTVMPYTKLVAQVKRQVYNEMQGS